MTSPGHLEWKGKRVSRLVLGTAQLGMPYGIANTTGQPSEQGSRKIIEEAWRLGVETFDTAQAYGSSETVLGSALSALGVSQGASVVTKLSPDLNHLDAGEIRHAADESCRRLRTDRLWCLMLHREERLGDWSRGLGRALRDLRTSGQVEHLGASVYSVRAANAALENPDIDMIQVPCNAWDTRMRVARIPELAEQKGKLCFVRSIYLQGLLALCPGAVREIMPFAGGAASRWWDCAKAKRSTAATLALRYALSLDVPLVIGVDTIAQLKDNVERMAEAPMDSAEIEEMSALLGPVDQCVLDPCSWLNRAAGAPGGKQP